MHSVTNSPTGVLYPSAVKLDTFLEDQIMRWVPEWLRNRGFGDLRYPGLAGSCGRIS